MVTYVYATSRVSFGPIRHDAALGLVPLHPTPSAMRTPYAPGLDQLSPGLTSSTNRDRFSPQPNSTT